MLSSDLGGGKTTFVQGLAAGLGYTGAVTSPTFTVSNIYKLDGGREIHHYDLYRLTEAGVMSEELQESLKETGVITIIEWPAIVSGHLPADRLTINFEPTSETSRTLKFASGGPKSDKIIESLEA